MSLQEHIVCVMAKNVQRLLEVKSIQCLTAPDITEDEKFAIKYLLTSYSSKYNGHDKSKTRERESATYQKWLRSERLCYDTNVRLAFPSPSSITGRLLAEMRVHITRILGKMPGDYYDFGGFSGGATVDIKRGAHYTEKVWGAISCGDNNIIDACYAVGKFSPHATVYPHGYCRATQVPKNNTINRMIAIEPTASVYMQKAIGSLIRKRLKRVGVDLDDQTINQRSAQKAYAESLATLDLSSASDTMSLDLVRSVMPSDWLRELEKHRSPCMKYLGRILPLSKFSSMGNGYTFELESLIFWALCKSVCKFEHINVYGDDLIIRQEDAPAVIAGLTIIGFQTNVDKSFIAGDFFESCGKHYFKGHDVTPCYQKEDALDLASAMRMHNRLVRWALNGPLSRFDVIHHACDHIINVFGHRDCAIPYGVQRDDGWLVSPDSPLIATDCNGDYQCHVMVQASLVKKLRQELHGVAYNYKLVHFHHQNEDPRGSPGKPGRQVVRRRKVVIWRTNTLS
jgi:hypothetical protein